MATITTRAGKGSPLTNTEVDNNFTNINTELGQKESASNKGVANGYASLDGSGKVPSTQLPSYVDDVVEGANLAAFPATGETGKIYVTLDTNKTYRWSGSAYVEISASPGSTDAVTEGSTNLYFTNARARSAISATGSLSYNSSTGVMSFTDAVTSVSGKTGAVTLTNSDVGLGNVENKSSATIRGELTSGNVTTALGYTPYNSSNPSNYITSSASITGNAATATSLQTARNINGTSFNGSANITTASWGTARTITIGSTGKSVDGSGNVSWTLGEIGAVGSGNTMTVNAEYSGTIAQNQTGWYTIASYGSGRAEATFHLSDQDSSRHNYVRANIVWSYGYGGIVVDTSGRHGVSTIRNIRLLYNTSDRTYGGVKVQVYCEGTGDQAWTLRVRQETTTTSGWGNFTEITPALEGTPAGWAEGYQAYYVNEQGQISTSSSSAYFAGNLALHAGNYSSYALPLSGGTLTGTLTGTTGRFQKNQTAGNYTTAALWTESYGNTATGVAFHISGNVGKFLEMRTDGILYWNGDTVIHSGNYSSWALPTSGGTLTGTLNVSNGNVIQFYTNNGSLRGYINATDTDDNHLQIATSGGEDIVFKDAGLGGTRNLVIRGANAGTEAYGSIRSPIFYDNADTNYYADPASTSQFNQARFVNRIAVGNGSTPYLNTGTAGIWFSNGGGSSHFAGSHDSDTSWWGVYTNSAWRAWLTGSGSWISTGDQRAPIWYDYNDTSFYLDPASTTTSLQIAGAIEQGNNFAHPNVEWSASSSSSGMVIFKLPGGSGNYGMVHMVFDIYEYNSPRIATVIVGGHNWNGSWYSTACNVIGYTDKQIRLGFKDGQYCVVFGTSGSGWSYGTIRLRKIHNGSFYNNQMDLGGSYSVSQTTTESFSAITGDLRGLRTPSTMEVDGILYGYNSIRSNIFYDNDNTGYYLDPASTSNINSIQIAGVINQSGPGRTATVSTSNYDAKIGSSDLYIYTKSIEGGSFPCVMQVFRVWDGATSWPLNLQPVGSGVNIGSYGDLGYKLGVYGSMASNDQIRAPIFYDYNNTGYYVDPASSSRLSTIYCGDVYNDLGGWFRNYGATGLYNQSYGNHFYSDSANYWNVGIGGQTSGGIRFRDTHAGTVRGYVYVDNGNNIGFLNSGGSWRARVVADDYFLVDGSSARAQIFYDSNDTTYYVNPNDYSVLYGLSTYYIKNNYGVGTDHPFGVYFDSGLSTAYAIYRESGSWTHPYPDLRIAFHTGIKLGANQSYNGIRFYNDYNMAGQVMSVNNGSDPLGADNVYVNNSLQAGSSLRAPIFYDSNDTGYYLDGASTSRLNYVVPNRIKCVNNVNNEPRWDFSAYVVEAQHWYGNNSSMTMYLGESNYINIRNTADIWGDTRSPIYYDRNNTGYFLDPTSNTAIRTVGSWRADAADWDGEFSGKIQYHASHWYLQSGSLWIFRNAGGSNILQVDQSGNLTAQGNVTAYSDRRLKENVLTLSGASDYLARIDAKTFRWKSDGRNDIGFIAQDVEEAGLPEFVIIADTYNPATGETAEPIKSLDYGRMVSVLWQAVKEQKSQIAAMSAEINSLKERLQ